MSSRLRLGDLRRRIKDTLQELGFSVEIYEADSTPSSEPATYLRDIEDADFVIFIFDETYGTPRAATGRSGAHEEWERVIALNIPNHVYLKKLGGARLESRQKKFIESELVAREISYFYYYSQPQLMNQIRASVVKMVLDIARSRPYRKRLSSGSLMVDLVERDYNTFHRWNKALIELVEYEAAIEAAHKVTNGWAHLTDFFPTFDPVRFGPFLDYKMQELFAEFIYRIHSLVEYESRHTVDSTAGATFNLPYEPFTVSVFTLGRPYPHNFFEDRAKLKRQVLADWSEIKSLIDNRYVRYASSM